MSVVVGSVGNQGRSGSGSCSVGYGVWGICIGRQQQVLLSGLWHRGRYVGVGGGQEESGRWMVAGT